MTGAEGSSYSSGQVARSSHTSPLLLWCSSLKGHQKLTRSHAGNSDGGAASAQPEHVLVCSCGSTSNGVILGMPLILFLTVACSTVITNNVLYVKDMIATQCLSMTLTTIYAPEMQSFAECSGSSCSKWPCFGLCSSTNSHSYQFRLGCGKQ